MAKLVNIAGDGLPLYLWTKLAQESDGATPWSIGEQRAQRDNGSFSYRNCVLREQGGEVAAALIGYPLDARPDPARFDDMPAMFVPLQQLEDLVPGTWYVNVLATFEPFRGMGFGRELLAVAECMAIELGCDGMSLIVSDANAGARRLYARCGYDEHASRPMVKESWANAGENWILLHKAQIASAAD